MDTFVIEEREGNFTIRARVDMMSDDLLVTLYGGEEHVGAIGIAEPRPSLRNPRKTSSTGSVFTFLGHKEDMVAKNMAEELAGKLNKKVIVVAGIHWDHLKTGEIGSVLDACGKVTKRVMREVKKR